MRKTKVAGITLFLLLGVGVTGVVAVRSISFFSTSGCHKRKVSRGQAEKIATEKLKEYCEREGLSTSQFGKPEVSSVEEVPWIFDYTSNTSPRHFVRVHIDECGVVEVSAEIYNS